MNAYESGARKAVPAVLIYLFHSGRVLMMHRGTRGAQVDYHHGKWNGLGGKLEPDESYRSAARRELREESGLDLPEDRLNFLGFLQFPNFKAHRSEDWLVQVFVADLKDAEAHEIKMDSPEGTLHWLGGDEVLKLNLWPGDRHFLPRVLARERFLGTFWYAGQELLKYELQSI